MWFRLMGACRMLDSDQDGLEKYVRTARAVFFTAVVTCGKWMAGSVQDILFQGQAYNDSLFDVLFFPCLLFILVVCIKGGEVAAKPMRKRYLWLPALALVVFLGETATLSGWWDLGPTLGWWRSGLLAVAAATLVMWATERTVRSLRSDRSDVRSQT